ncbi:hypothetical protein M7I_8332 [Glarea lozoyensis 74030]|uniref:Uncharacterized protein n=1 Tax=Glarea lozoyensis (strain ATCC 74030 / MF5533) TaxID=1104152 RepID=H0EZQ5_GLAL7|nr:hypothetical protein M7I_8332 [Glarea lozoyensis 74030]
MLVRSQIFLRKRLQFAMRRWKSSLDADNIAREIFRQVGLKLAHMISGNQLFGDIGPDEEDEEEVHSLITKHAGVRHLLRR